MYKVKLTFTSCSGEKRFGKTENNLQMPMCSQSRTVFSIRRVNRIKLLMIILSQNFEYI
jgi:hypothetical protein